MKERINMNNVSQNSDLEKGSEVSLLPLIKIFLKNRWLIITLTFVGLCLGLLKSALFYSKVYSASSSILLQSSQKVTSQDYSKVYLDSIVQSTCSIISTSSTTVRNIILQQYTYDKNGQKVKINLLEFYNSSNINTLIERVSRGITLTYDKQTRVLTISYRASNPEIASQIVNNVIEQINIFYNTQMTSDSARNFKFIEEQLKIAKENLDTIRLKLALFIKRNKEITTASEANTYSLAKLELQKLQEDTKAKEYLYDSLVKKSQDLGLQSEQKTPSVIVLQQAFPSQKPIPRKMLQGAILGSFLMLLVAIGIVVLKNLSEITKENIVKLVSYEFSNDFKKLKKILKKNNAV